MPRSIRDPAADPHLRMQRLRSVALEHAGALCELLPGAWQPVPHALYQAVIGAGDGRQLILTATTGAKGEDRLKIGTTFASELRSFAEGQWEISVTLAKNVEVIAREIERRLLPDLDAALARAQSARAAEEERQARFQAALTRIEQALPAARHLSHGPLNTRVFEGTGDLRGEFTVDGNGLTGGLHLRWASLDLLEALAHVIAGQCTAAPPA
jgi:hypothetical protein